MSEPPKLKMFKDKTMKEEIPFLGFPEKAISMGTTGKVEAFLVNMSKNDFVVEEASHPDKDAVVELGSKRLSPFIPVKIKLSWSPPFSDEPLEWKPLKGNIHIKGYYIVT